MKNNFSILIFQLINMKENILKIKSKIFAIEIINLYKRLSDEKREFVMSKQLLRSGTSIGANICESEFAQTKPDFITKITISLKEANETNYWLELLFETQYIEQNVFEDLQNKCKELIKILVASIKTSKSIQ